MTTARRLLRPTRYRALYNRHNLPHLLRRPAASANLPPPSVLLLNPTGVTNSGRGRTARPRRMQHRFKGRSRTGTVPGRAGSGRSGGSPSGKERTAGPRANHRRDPRATADGGRRTGLFAVMMENRWLGGHRSVAEAARAGFAVLGNIQLEARRV